MLDVHRLRVLRSVVASGSVGAAADRLGFTASAVSQHLSALQRETGLVLLERSGRGVRATAAGIALAAEADAVLARLGEAETLVADLRARRSGVLSIGYFASVGAAWLPGVVARLVSAFPDVRFALRLEDEIADDPEQRADLQVVVGGSGLDAGVGFTAHHLLDDPYVAVVPLGHRIATRGAALLAELAGEPWIDNDFAFGRCRRVLLDACAAAGFSPTFRVEAHDYRAAIAFVAAGLGITVLPALGAVDLPPGVVAVPITGAAAPVRTIQVLVRDSAAGAASASFALLLLQRSGQGRALADG